MTDWSRKRNASRAMPAGERTARPGGNSNRLTQVARAADNAPAERSRGSAPIRTSQRTRNQAARKTTLRGRAPLFAQAARAEALAFLSVCEFMAINAQFRSNG